MLDAFDKDWRVVHQIIAAGGRLCKIRKLGCFPAVVIRPS